MSCPVRTQHNIPDQDSNPDSSIRRLIMRSPRLPVYLDVFEIPTSFLCCQRLLYWTDVGKNPKIEQAAMDGTARRVIVNENLGAPNGLTMDHSSNRLYWIDAKLDRIEEFDLNNRNRRVILYFTTDVSPFGLTMNNDWLYWSEWKTKTISRVSKSRGKNEIIAYGLKIPMDLFVYDAAGSSPGKRSTIYMFVKAGIYFQLT